MKKTFKRLTSYMLVILMLFTSLPISSFASVDLSNSSTAVDNAFGDGLFWSFDDVTGTLTIKGEGAMPDFAGYEPTPEDYADLDVYEYFGVEKDVPASEPEVQAMSSLLSDEGNPLNEILPSVDGLDLPDILNQKDGKELAVSKQAKSKAKAVAETTETAEEPVTPTETIPWKEHIGKVKQVVVEEGITSIGAYSFAFMICLESVSLPSTLVTIGDYAFASCFKLSSVNIPEGVTSIGEAAFHYCVELSNVTFPSTLKTIGNNAFCLCFSISEIIIPESIETIGQEPFGMCVSAGTISIPSTYSGDLRMGGFYSLTNVYNYSTSYSFINNNREAIGYFENKEYADFYISYLKFAYPSDTIFYLTDTTDEAVITDILIKMFNVESEEEFANKLNEATSGLKQGTENVTITCKEESAEHDAVKMFDIKHILFGSNELHECTEFSGNVSETLAWRIDTETKALIFEGTGEIPDYGDNSADIAAMAPWSIFSGKYNKVDFRNAEITRIGSYAFYRSRITTAAIPDNVEEIASYAFYDCDDLKTVIISSGVSRIDAYAFDCYNLKSITIYNPDCWLGYRISSSSDTTIFGYDGSTAEEHATNNNMSFVSIGSIPDSVSESDFTVSANEVYDEYEDEYFEDGTVTITKYNGMSRNVTIPETIGGKTVTGIGEGAFRDCSKLTSVIIPDSVTSIGREAFWGCSGLTSITIPNSVTSIGYFAFTYCTGLTSVIISESVTIIMGAAFRNCSGLTSVTIPASVTSVGDYAFGYCDNLTDITIMNPSCSIDDSSNTIVSNATIHGYEGSTAEDYATKYERTFISIGTFSDEVSENDFTYSQNSDGTVTITDYNGKSRNVTIPETIGGKNVSRIGDDAFENRSGLTKIIIPNSVTSIGCYAFSGCIGLTSMVIPDSVTSIDNDAFRDCSGLTSVIISNSVTEIDCFQNCSGLTSIIIPNSVTCIGHSAFENCSGLTSVTIPASVTSIGDCAFGYCDNLTDITIMNPSCSIDDSSNTIVSNATIHGYEGSTAEDYATKYERTFVSIGIFSDEVSENDFTYSQNNDGTVTITDYNGKSRNVTILETIGGKTVTGIGYSAFKDCSALKSIVIPDSVTSIGSDAFRGCNGLTSITVPESVKSISKQAFCGCNNLDISIMNPDCSIYEYIDTIDSDATINGYDISTAKDYALEYGVQFVSMGLLPDEKLQSYFLYRENDDGTIRITGYKCNIKNMTIPKTINGKTVTSIDNAAFCNKGIVSITIPDSVTSIGSFAFNSCSNLTDIFIYNYNCNIYDNSTTIPSNTKIHGYLNSTTAEYASKYNRNFEEIVHEHEYKVINVSTATCTEDEVTTYHCDVCKHTYKKVTKEALGHSYGEWQTVKEPTCTEKGSKQRVCANDSKHIETEDITALGHDFSKEWLTDIEPTCETAGSKSHHCSRCNEKSDVTEIQSLGHKYTSVITNPTCTANGYTVHTCSVCGNSYTDSIVPALKHDFSKEWTVDLKETCTTDGLKSHHCSRCDEKSDVTVIEKLNHKYEVSIVKPTCVADGYTSHVCSRCGHTYHDEIVAAKGHKYKTETYEPTCTNDGYTKHTCTVCNNSYKDNIVEKLNHYMSDYVLESKPDCLHDGIEKSTCSRCDHVEIIRTSKLGHLYGEWVTVKEPSVLADGLRKHICSRCNSAQTEKLPKIEVDIETNTNYGLCNFTVVNAQTKEPINGASIFISTQNDGENTFTTDKNGVVSIVLPVGNQRVSAYAKGCQTRNLSINVQSGTNEIPTIGLSKQNVYDAKLTSHRMTEQEIVAAGIDINDPANKNVYEYNLKIEYEAQPAPVIINFAKNNKNVIVHSSHEHSDGYIYIPEHKISIAPVSENLYVIVHGNVKWLKEIFDVELLVINNSSTDTLENVKAVLNLPEGLSLAKLINQDQNICQTIGTVKENSTESVHWYVCGDTAGSFKISANLTGVIMPFEEPIDQIYNSENALHVWGGNALKLNFELPDVAYYGEDYSIKIRLKNVSDIPLYNVNHVVSVYQGMEYYYSDGRTQKKLQTGPDKELTVGTLNPGDEIIIEANINIFFESEIMNFAKNNMISKIDEFEKATKIYKLYTSICGAADSIVKSKSNLTASLDGLKNKLSPEKYEAAVALYGCVSDIGDLFTDDNKVVGKLFKFGDLLVDVSNELYSMAKDPIKYIADNTLEEIGELINHTNALQKAIEGNNDDTDSFDIFDTLRTIISQWPIEFVIKTIVMTEGKESTTTIPYTITTTHLGKDHYHGVNNMTDCALALMNIGVHEIFRGLLSGVLYLDVFDLFDNEEIYKKSMKTLQTKANELIVFNAKDSSGDVKWNAYVVKDAFSARKALSETAAKSDNYILESNGNNAVFENGVLTFEGAGMISFTAASAGNYQMIIENDKGLKYTYDISVAQEHDCMAGESEYLITPINNHDGLAATRCTICDKMMDLSIVSFNECGEHEFGEMKTIVDASCQNNGLRIQECQKCGYCKSELEEALSHTSDGGSIITQPTCFAEGIKVYTCTVCGLVFKSEALVKLPHDYSKYEVIIPTCTSMGYTVYKCSVCEGTYNDDEISALPHTSDNGKVTVQPSCLKEGIKTYTCTVCKNVIKNESIAKLSHNYKAEAVYPTCTLDGYIAYTCTTCGDSYNDNIVPALGHADTTGDGHCDLCGIAIILPISCSHICHKTGFVGFIYKIVRLFWKLFKINQYCKCGAAHY